jgi:integrase
MRACRQDGQLSLKTRRTSRRQPSVSCKNWSHKRIRERWGRILLSAGVGYRNPYQTRHTYASSLLMLGANPLYVATQLGHVDTTLVFRTYGRWISAGLNQNKRERLLRFYSRTDAHCANEFRRFA